MKKYFKITKIDAEEFINAAGEDLYCCQIVVHADDGALVAVDTDDEYEICIPLDVLA